jgi:nucleotide-binding universal stress UspA family protein
VPFKLELVRFATDSDSIGAIVCRRAEQLNAGTVVMAKHSKGRLREFFVGSVTTYCTHHCKSPLLVMHCD